MTTYIALLRGINVGGRALVSMSHLRRSLTDLGLADVRTLIQSGNVVFRDNRKPDALERLLEGHAQKTLGRPITFFVRTAAELDDVIARNPFPEEAKRDPGHLVVTFLKTAPPRAALRALEAAISGPETIAASGKQLFIVYPAGIGRSRLTNKLIEDKLATSGTARNWNTILKLAAMTRP